MNQTHRPHDDTVIELLREDPLLAAEFLAVSLEEQNQPGGREALAKAVQLIEKSHQEPAAA